MPDARMLSPQEALLRKSAVPREELARPGDQPGWLRCVACAHRCPIGPGRSGVCRVRFNDGGRLFAPWGYTAYGLALDPIEKKPFFHAMPGAAALSFGMLGCNFHCAYCQNWETSQALRDPVAGAGIVSVTPEAIAQQAVRAHARAVTSTYNEPLITAEWAADVFDRCRGLGLVTGMVSNGHATPEVLDFLRPRMDLYKVDLKSFRDREYRKLGGVLEHVLDGVRLAAERGLWVEVVTLVVPGFNDDDGELRDIARFIAGVSRDIPWHVTAFHPDYKMDDRGPTPRATVLRAAELGREEGLRFVYPGNLPGLGDLESTHCPACGELLVRRTGFHVHEVRLRGGACPACRAPIPGFWPDARVPPTLTAPREAEPGA